MQCDTPRRENSGERRQKSFAKKRKLKAEEICELFNSKAFSLSVHIYLAMLPEAIDSGSD
jgi:hypothetical protein